MRRAPIVLASTAAGLGLVLSFHTSGSSSSRLSTSSAGTEGPSGTSGSKGVLSPSSPSGTSTTTQAPSPATKSTRRGTGEEIEYRYGAIELEVTQTGSRITNITVVQDDSSDPRSEQINSQAVPILQSQALEAQSANIDGVSGATFTSQAYAQALQSALSQIDS